LLSLTITSPSDADQRIDKFIKKYLPEAPLGGIYKWLRTGKIKVNRKKVDQTYRIEEGDVIDIYLHDAELEKMRSSYHPSKRGISPPERTEQMLRTSA
jgi:23S rRNA-/tRNA-specific pseudouridylate synthase